MVVWRKFRRDGRYPGAPERVVTGEAGNRAYATRRRAVWRLCDLADVRDLRPDRLEVPAEHIGRLRQHRVTA